MEQAKAKGNYEEIKAAKKNLEMAHKQADSINAPKIEERLNVVKDFLGEEKQSNKKSKKSE